MAVFVNSLCLLHTYADTTRRSRKFALSCIVGRWSSNSQEVSKKVKKGRTATQNSSGIHRVLVLMPISSRIRALREKGNPAA